MVAATEELCLGLELEAPALDQQDPHPDAVKLHGQRDAGRSAADDRDIGFEHVAGADGSTVNEHRRPRTGSRG